MRHIVTSTVLCALACSEVAGLGSQRKVDSDAASSDASGSGGVAGQGGGGAAGGSGGSAGVAGSAGAGATAGVGASDAGADACASGTLGDGENCGSCGHDCLGGDCEAGACQPVELVQTAYGGWDIAVGADAVFWTNQVDGNFVRMPKTSPSPQSWPGLLGPKDVAFADGFAYAASPGKDAVFRAPADGLTPPSTHWTAPQAIETLSADASGVYFDGPNAIYVTNGSQQTLLASVIDQPMLIATDATHVYFTTLDAGHVYRFPKTGTAGPLTPLVSAGTKTRALALDAQWLYFGTWENGSPVNSNVYRIGKDGSGTLQTIGGGPGAIKMVRAGAYLYWANQGTQPAFSDGTIQRARVDGATPGAVETVASAQNRPRGIAADSTAVYWLNCGWPSPATGSVWRHAL